MAPNLSARMFDSVSRWIFDNTCGWGAMATSPERLQKAKDRCREAPGRSSQALSPYPDSYRYCKVEANAMYYNAGDTKWAQEVRGCLTCMDQEGVEPHDAHMFCYEQGTDKAKGFSETVRGYADAVSTATKNVSGQVASVTSAGFSSVWKWATSWW